MSSAATRGNAATCYWSSRPGTQTLTAPGLDLDLERLHLCPVAAVELVTDLPAQLDLDRALRFGRLHEGRFACRAERSARQRAGPFEDALGADDTELKETVVWLSVLEHLDPAEDARHVADEDAARLARVPADAVHLDFGAERLCPQALRPGPHVGDASDPVLEAAVGAAEDHRCVEADAGHHREAPARGSVPHRALRRSPWSPTATAPSTCSWNAEIRREEICGTGRNDCESRLRACEDVHATLHHSIAAPREHELGAVVSALGEPAWAGALVAFLHFAPERFIADALGREYAAKLKQAAAKRLARSAQRRRPSSPQPPSRAAADAAAKTARNEQDSHGCHSDHDSARDVQRMVHAAIHPRRGHERRDRNGNRPGDGAEEATRESGWSRSARPA